MQNLVKYKLYYRTVSMFHIKLIILNNFKIAKDHFVFVIIISYLAALYHHDYILFLKILFFVCLLLILIQIDTHPAALETASSPNRS